MLGSETTMSAQFMKCPGPGCDRPASLDGADLWPSTNGPILMVKVFGACGHWFKLPASKLDLDRETVAFLESSVA
jgi:hypothetical protein